MEEQRARPATPRPAAKRATVFVPVLLVVIALAVMTGFQTIQLNRERDVLKQRLTLQEEPLKESQNVREQLQSVATSTAELAEQGNPNAQQIIDQLQKAGITVNTESGAE